MTDERDKPMPDYSGYYEEDKPVEKHPYVTINGKEPEEPISFFRTKKFFAVSFVFMLLVGFELYQIFAH